MEIKKIVISPSNSRAIEFLNSLNKKKAETFKKIENLPNLFLTAKKSKQLAERDFYSYLKLDEDDDNEIYYQFLTSHYVLYTVYFTKDGYSDFIKHFPNLLENGYAFGFHRQKTDDSKNHLDEKIFETIYRIVLDFMASHDNKTVLLYHCDQSDNRQAFRSKLFDKWAAITDERTEIVKHSISIIVDDLKSKDAFIGFVAHSNNLIISDIKKEFDEFAVNFMVVANEKNQE